MRVAREIRAGNTIAGGSYVLKEVARWTQQRPCGSKCKVSYKERFHMIDWNAKNRERIS